MNLVLETDPQTSLILFNKVATYDSALDTRSASELTQEELASRAGVSSSNIIPSSSGTGFMVGPESTQTSPISDTSEQRSAITSLGGDITKALSDIGIMIPTTDSLNKTLTEQQQLIESRQQELQKRETEDIAGMEKGLGAAEEELRLRQEESLAQAEGRTRIGGFFTQLEAQDIQRLQRQHRVELATFQAQRQQTLQAARRAYRDQDYQLAKDQLDSAKEIEKTIYDRSNDYLNNILKMQEYYSKLNKPLKDAEQADIDSALEMINAAPSAFRDVSPSDVALGKVTYGDILQKYLNSSEYKLSLREQQAEVLRKEQLLGGETESKNEFNLAEQFVFDNPTASDDELRFELLRRTDLSITEINSLLSVREKAVPTTEQSQQKIVDAVQKLQTAGFGRDDAELRLIEEVKKSLGLSKDQDIPDSFDNFIQDALVEIYGQTFWQKYLPFGR